MKVECSAASCSALLAARSTAERAGGCSWLGIRASGPVGAASGGRRLPCRILTDVVSGKRPCPVCSFGPVLERWESSGESAAGRPEDGSERPRGTAGRLVEGSRKPGRAPLLAPAGTAEP
ncbi:hypothetical protein GCM10010430_39600 [Kitasatospora cystarginea]|uniref:Secreted protein n=1 Tax=Kitasatospora cystarginea TaxID=58350 RepID=A0ABN3EAA9_9ACTN